MEHLIFIYIYSKKKCGEQKKNFPLIKYKNSFSIVCALFFSDIYDFLAHFLQSI